MIVFISSMLKIINPVNCVTAVTSMRPCDLFNSRLTNSKPRKHVLNEGKAGFHNPSACKTVA